MLRDVPHIIPTISAKIVNMDTSLIMENVHQIQTKQMTAVHPTAVMEPVFNAALDYSPQILIATETRSTDVSIKQATNVLSVDMVWLFTMAFA